MSPGVSMLMTPRRFWLPTGAGWAFIDMPEFKTTIKQELEPQKLMYLRFHGRNREKWRKHETTGERYDYLYSEDELEPFAKKVREIAATGGSKILIYFNNHVRGQAPANALMMARQIGMPATATVSEEFVKAFPADQRRSQERFKVVRRDEAQAGRPAMKIA